MVGMSMSRGWALLLRGIRWRLMGSVLIVLTAAIAMGTAIIGPLYVQAGGDSLVRRAVATAPENATGLSLEAQSGHAVSGAQVTQEQTGLLRRGDLVRRFGAPLTTVNSGAHLTTASGTLYATQLASRTGICGILHVSPGHCDLGRDDAVISSRTARKLDLTVGDTLTVTTPAGKAPVALTITGLFSVPDLTRTYWFDEGTGFFQFGIPTGPATAPIQQVDDLFVSAATATGLPAGYLPATSIQTPLRPGAIGLGDAEQTMRSLTAAQGRATRAGFNLSTGLPALLSGALHQRRLMDTIVTVAAVQLALLAIWVLAAVLLRSADLRRSELRVARLRGFPPISMLAVTVAEPAILCGVGAVLGVIGAWAGVEIASAALFSSGTTVSVGPWVFIGFGAAALTICAVLGVSALRLLRGSGLERDTPAAAATAGRSRVIFDVAILVVSAMALLAAATSGALASHSNPIAAAAPAVVALGTSVIAIRIVELLCRRASRATIDSRSVAGFLAVRQIGRRPAALRESRTLVIALCLACFAVCAWSVARSNRATAATFSVGAPTVVTVAQTPVLQQTVDRVDPQGHFAMAAIQITTPIQNLIGVDSTRMAAVVSWPRGISATTVAAASRALSPASAPPVNLGTGTGTVKVAMTVRGSGAAAAHLRHLDLSLWVFNAQTGTNIVDLGGLRSGTGSYESALTSVCPSSCRLVGIGVLPDVTHAPASGSVAVTVTGLSVSSGTRNRVVALTPRSGDLTAADWRSSTAGVSVAAAHPGVSFLVTQAAEVAGESAVGGVTPPQASLADTPSVIPEIGGSEVQYAAAESDETGRLNDAGLDGNPITVRPLISATALPRLGSSGQMADLDLLERAQVGSTSPDVTDEVWLGPHAPADAVARLRAAGLRVTGVQRASSVIRAGRHTGPALAYDFMLLATLVALLVAAVGTFSVLAAGTRQRATELTSLEVSGVPRPLLRRSLAYEAAILAFTALFGAAAGAVGAAIAIPSLPQLGTASHAPLSYGLPVLLILTVALVAVIVVLGATAIAARGILSRMSPSLLRAVAYDAD
jgi:putative ABC transport system permease protein